MYLRQYSGDAGLVLCIVHVVHALRRHVYTQVQVGGPRVVVAVIAALQGAEDTLQQLPVAGLWLIARHIIARYV